MLATEYGQTLAAPPALGSLVPEPASLALLVALIPLRRRCAE